MLFCAIKEYSVPDLQDKDKHKTLWDNSGKYCDILNSKPVPDTYNHFTSTHHDIQGNIPTEIYSQTGKVIQLGEVNNVY